MTQNENLGACVFYNFMNAIKELEVSIKMLCHSLIQVVE